MAPKKQKKQMGASMKPDMSRSDSTGWEASQELQNSRINEMMNKGSERVWIASLSFSDGNLTAFQTKERRNKRKQAFKASQDAQVQRLRAKVESAAKQHDENVRAIHRPGLERLLELAQKKRKIENSIATCQAELEQAYLSAARQLQVSLEGRLEEMDEEV
ncbi:uncharacterized protein LTR77_002185 [Saxophila tyrrhenica]|uniref:Uncharacterized protein n=1 Tax=Saxophila tyrrhenica TaxID=1690608 RepID=A0AAV9PHV7_9PEZI|nr:hypothetical protein LTR77_002185 [Saxophila tyrrhenica]